MRYYNGEDYDEAVKNGIILVDFYADWCGPCKMLGSVLEEIEDKVDILKVNVDNYSDLADRFKIMSIPHVKIYKDGEEVAVINGFIDKESLLEKIEEVNNL